MSRIDQLKAEAITLETEEKNAGRTMKHCAALEIIARRHGYETWRACVARLAEPSVGGSSKGIEGTEAVALKHVWNKQWGFGLSIPTRWNEFPPILSNSPYEVARFASNEDGTHLIIVFRMPGDPTGRVTSVTQRVQVALAKSGFGNFKTGSSRFGHRSVVTLDFDKPLENGLWSGRQYFIAHGTLAYVLGCGTTKGVAMFELYNRIAETFEPEDENRS